MNLIEKLDKAASDLKARGVGDGELAATLKRLIHSPAVALIVALTPNKADDAALEVLKALFPA